MIPTRLLLFLALATLAACADPAAAPGQPGSATVRLNGSNEFGAGIIRAH